MPDETVKRWSATNVTVPVANVRATSASGRAARASLATCADGDMVRAAVQSEVLSEETRQVLQVVDAGDVNRRGVVLEAPKSAPAAISVGCEFAF